MAALTSDNTPKITNYGSSIGRLLALAGTDPARDLIWSQRTDFYLHCGDSVAQLRPLAWTVHAWQP